MAVLIGVVSSLIGQVFKVTGGGKREAVAVGERLYAGDTLDTGAEGAVGVHLTNGKDLTLGRGSSLQLSSELLSDHPPSIVVHDTAAPDGSQLTEVQQIQQAIAAGADPTQSLEATAAGPNGVAVYTNTPAGDLGGGHSFVLLSETAGVVAPVVGFPTAGLGFALLDVPPQVADPLQTTDDAGNPVVVPPIVVVPDNGVTFANVGASGGDQQVSEADLPDGTNAARGIAGDLSRAGTFSVAAPDGLSSLTIDGIQVLGNGQLVSNTVQVTGPLGNVLTITGYNASTGTFNYTYVLSQDQVNNQTDTNLAVSENFQLVAQDTDGDSGNATLVVQINDDSPIANNDVGNLTQQTPQISGSVLTNDFVGADSNATPVSFDPALNPAVTVVGQTFIGTYGTLTLSSTGAYTYSLNTDTPAFQTYKESGVAAQDVFTYTLTDGDGDTSTATLTLNLAPNNPISITGLGIAGGDLNFSEANLPAGTSTDPDKASLLTDTKTFTIDAKDGLATLNIESVVNGVTVTTAVIVNGQLVNAAGVPVEGESGNTLTIKGYDPATGVVTYSYTLTDTVHNAAPGSADSLATTQDTDHFQVIATDKDGDSSSAPLDVVIQDDAPIAQNDQGDAVVSTQLTTLEGSVLGNDKVGADTNATPVSIKDANGNLVTSIDGTYGTLNLGTDGNYTYTLDPTLAAYKALQTGQTATETFAYTLTDGDGDTATANLVIDVKGDHGAGVGITVDCDTLVAQESNLPGGTTATPGGETVDSFFTVTAPDGVASLVVGGITVYANGQLIDFSDPAQASITTAEGNTFTVLGYDMATGVVKYEYTMNHALDNTVGDGNSITETFAVVAQDTDGDTSTANLNVQVVDDTPTAAAQEVDVSPVPSGTNILLVIDISDSMRTVVDGTGGLTRLDVAKQAVDAMLLKYAAIGDVMVQVTSFNNQTHQVSGTWVSVEKAIELVNGLTPSNGTNYDYALDGAKAAYVTDGKLDAPGTQNVSYFVSDGDPTLSSQIDHETPEQWMGSTDPLLGDGIDAGEEAVWTDFLKLHDIKSYSFGIGTDPTLPNLEPIAYDGSTDSEIPAVLVKDISTLPDALGSTISGTVNGSLLADGGYGADGGFVQSVTVDGVKYSFDGANTVTPGDNAVAGDSQYNAATHQLMISTQDGGALQINMLTGAYLYVSPSTVATAFTETVLFTLTDNDGDVSSNVLTVHVKAEAPVLAADETIITNSLDSTVTVPAAALLDSASSGTHLTSSTTFDTGWSAARAADFTGTSSQPIVFRATQEDTISLQRSQFVSNAAAMTAALVVAGALGEVGTALASDTIDVVLKKGETVHLDSTLTSDHASLSYAAESGAYVAVGSDGNFTATQDGTYHIQVANLAGVAGSQEDYNLSLTIDYSHTETVPVHTDSYSIADSSGAGATGALAIQYQAGAHLVGTDGNDILISAQDHSLLEGGKGDDVLIAGNTGDDLYGNDGNDLLIGGAGDDTLDGGAGNNTASYQAATAGVHVDLNLQGAPQATGGAGNDTLTGIQNLIGSDHNDVLIGDINDNVLIGGKGDDTLTGGGGHDTFKWLANDANGGHDTVTDFTLGKDTLDLSQLLQGENSVASSLENFLQFKVTGSGDSLVSTIEISSLGNDTTNQTISLDHVNVASTYGVQVGAGGIVANGHDTATIISGMLSDHSLKADTV